MLEVIGGRRLVGGVGIPAKTAGSGIGKFAGGKGNDEAKPSPLGAVPKIGTVGAANVAGAIASELAAEVTSLGGGVMGSGLSAVLLGIEGGGGIVPITGEVTAAGTIGMTVGVAPISAGFLGGKASAS